MPILLLFAALQSDIAELIERLADDDIEVRDRAEAQILKTGISAYPQLRRACDSDDAERRSRAASLLEHPVFARVPDVIDRNIRRLGSTAQDAWQQALERLLDAGSDAVPPLRAAAMRGDTLTAYRAAQVADILAAKDVNGLRFGVFVPQPNATVGGALPGIEVFINATSTPIVIDAGPHASIFVKPPQQCWWSMGLWRSREPEVVTIGAGRAHLKWRDLLEHRWDDRDFSENPGEWEITAVFSRDTPGRWTGSAPANGVKVTLRARPVSIDVHLGLDDAPMDIDLADW